MLAMHVSSDDLLVGVYKSPVRDLMESASLKQESTHQL